MTEPTPRRRTIKGLPRLPLTDVDRATELKAAEASLYYWWWVFLRENQDYRRAISGRKEQPWARMAADFGRLGDRFETWWFERGRSLFQEQVAIPRVRKLQHTEPANYDSINRKLIVELPLTIRRKTILRQVSQLLDAELNTTDTKYFSQLRVHAHSTAKRRIYPSQRIRLSTFKPLLQVWQARKANKTKPWWEIGEELKLSPSYVVEAGDDEQTIKHNRRMMTLIVQRHYRRATALIDFAGRGDFPRFK